MTGRRRTNILAVLIHGIHQGTNPRPGETAPPSSAASTHPARDTIMPPPTLQHQLTRPGAHCSGEA